MAVSAAIATIAFQSTSHAAQLTYDLRAVSTGVLAGDVTTPTVNISIDGHTVIAAEAGSVIVLQLWAILDNGNGLNTDDGVKAATGSFIGDASGVGRGLFGAFRGDVSGSPTQVNNVPGANGLVATSGVTFLGADGGTTNVGDITNHGPATTNAPWFVALGTGAGGVKFGTGATANDTEVLIGETTFTLAPNAPFSTSTSLIFVPRLFNTGIPTSGYTNNQFTIDGVPFKLQSDSPQIAEIGVNVFLVPEPSAIGMLLLGTLGLVGFRRSAFRRLSV